ncbi:putative zinc finger CCCH domain-containing protein 57-like [Tropilaelaps mercedesae]|uniref:Putative zinc finger CCCH domain-containing protein 57-like n=1 Tax=Tropilaelaps mercedesae TaxID=418985 RepID=A0A1V9XMT6_9ACAR|nr:putative zinc finger CCCH domain-containing protein 57-like [Tropilaelaps mercedesae]
MSDNNHMSVLQASIPRGRTRPHLTKAQKKKTELCRNISEAGSCQYEERCLFAHSEDELRLRPTNPRFRKDKCRTFHLEGFCGYGTRCSFQHVNRDELMTELNRMVENFRIWRRCNQQFIGQWRGAVKNIHPMSVNMSSYWSLPGQPSGKSNMTEELWSAGIRKVTNDSRAT